jgi:hypothetical protein
MLEGSSALAMRSASSFEKPSCLVGNSYRDPDSADKKGERRFVGDQRIEDAGQKLGIGKEVGQLVALPSGEHPIDESCITRQISERADAERDCVGPGIVER